MRRLPIRLRLTLPFAVAIALVLAGMAFFLYLRVGSALLASVDQNLRTQLGEMSGHVERGQGLGPRCRRCRCRRRGDPSERQRTALDPGEPDASALPSTARARACRPHSQVGLADPRLPRALAIVAAPVRTEEGDGALVVRPLERARRGARPTCTRALPGCPTRAPDRGPWRLPRRSGSVASGRGDACASRGDHRVDTRSAAARSQARDELARLAATLNDMLGRLEAAFEHERRFVADASHELRTPLTMLLTELDLALRRPRSRAELEEALRSAREETERLAELAEDLLLIARSDQGRLPVRQAPLEAHEVLYAVAERFAAPARERGRAVSVEEGPRLPLKLTAHVSNRRSATLSRTRWRTAWARWICRCGTATVAPSSMSPTRAPASLRISFRAHSTGSAAPTRHGARAEAGWALRSWR